jgi:hypothetical protein
MDSLTRQDLLAWRKRKARAKTAVEYIDRRLADFNAHPELLTLGDVERALHGYIPTKATETPFAAPETEEDDDDV